MRIGIDLMGSDSSPQQLFNGVLQAAKHYDSSYTFVCLAPAKVIDSLHLFAKDTEIKAQLEFHPAEDVITMEDDPLTAVRRKCGSSLMVGLQLLQLDKINGFVSAGNTGALIAGAKLLLPLLPSIRRPALLALLPAKGKMVAIVDAGGNLKTTLSSLIQNAFMGIAYHHCCLNNPCPVVGLLNIGREPNKGTILLRHAHAELKTLSQKSDSSELKFTFAGNLEARNLFEGKVDVLVTDGFTGNILLKTVEGSASFVLSTVLEQVGDSVNNEVLRSRFDFDEYPGALVCGVEGVVVKCHGSSSDKSIYNAICGATTSVHKQLISQMRKALGK